MIAFIHLGKTAGSTFKNVLRRSFGAHHCDAVASNPDRVFRDSDLEIAEKVYFGLWSLCSHHFQDPLHTLSAPLEYVTFLRDPVQRTASHYQHMNRERDIARKGGVLPDLEAWLQDDARNFQTRQISGGENPQDAIDMINERFMFVGLTEQYEASLSAFAALSPWRVNTTLERRNVAPNTSVKKKLTDDPEIRRMIEDATQADRAVYDYVKNELFPTQTRRAEKQAKNYPGSMPDRYQASRHFTNLVYRPAVKIKRALGR